MDKNIYNSASQPLVMRLYKQWNIIILIAFMLMIVTIPAQALKDDHKVVAMEWYQNWSLDSDRNGIDDRLEEEIAVSDGTGEYSLFVDYNRPTTYKDQQYLQSLGLGINYVSKYMPTIAVGQATPDVIHTLISRPEIVMVERDYPIIPFLDTSTPSLKARDSGVYSPNTAWDLGYTGKNIVIAILDTGVDNNHESLDGKFVAGVDVSNQGFDLEGDPDDGHGHGSHCAGTAMGNGGATDENSDGEPDYQGPAPDARLVDVKIGTDLGGNLGNSIIRGIEWCRDNKDQHGIRILSISFGSTSSSDGQDATSRAANAAVIEDGLILVVAAGNDGPNNNGIPPPAAADEVITIGATDNMDSTSRKDDLIADYSNRGPRADDGDNDKRDEFKPDVCAPGTDIMSVRHSEIGQGNANVQGQYVEMTGTSMACPHISGVIATMLEADPSLTPFQVKDILRQTSEKRGEVYDASIDEDYSKEYGWGIVDNYKAVKAALGEEPVDEKGVILEIDNPTDGEIVSEKVKIEGTASFDGNGTLDMVVVEINGEAFEAKGTENWSYSWNTWNVQNGNYSIYVKVTANNGTKDAKQSIVVEVNNTGKEPEKEDDEFIDQFTDVENYKELNETPGYLIAIIAAIIVVAFLVTLKIRSSGEDDDENSEKTDRRSKGKMRKRNARNDEENHWDEWN